MAWFSLVRLKLAVRLKVALFGMKWGGCTLFIEKVDSRIIQGNLNLNGNLVWVSSIVHLLIK